MIFLADESVEIEITERLRQENLQVYSISEIHPGLADEKVLHKARELKAILVTQDKDFGALVFQQKRVTQGVLLIRLPLLRASAKADLIVKTVKSYSREFPGSFAVLTEDEIRIRKLRI